MSSFSDITGAVRTAGRVIPMIYAYTTPEVARHDGWTKIGYTERQTVEDRIKQQSHTADVRCELQWKGSAIYDDGSGRTFTDHDLHAYLSRLGYERGAGTEWFRIAPDDARNRYYDFRQNNKRLDAPQTAPYVLREEQEQAVAATAEYYNTHDNGEYLWNAKPRFGKTLAVYAFCERIDAANVLILTNRPAIADSWYGDYEKFIGTKRGMYFVSSVDAIKDRPHCCSHKEYTDIKNNSVKYVRGCIEFVSLQDLKGSDNFGGKYDKLNEIADTDWDVLVLDEAHEGVETEKTDIALDRVKRKFTLNLSGTPFRMLASERFPESAIFNWTYADEQARKHERKYADMGDESPYAFLPKLNMFTYQMSDVIGDAIDQGAEIDDDRRAFYFDLNEFFKTKADGSFVHDEEVDRFLDALTERTKYPFSTPELRGQLRHTFWLLDRIDSAKALKEKLTYHPVFKEYKVVLAAGSGDDDREYRSALLDVRGAIDHYEKTITLSVGQLTTGVTVPEWTAVIMLCNCKSPALYMQAAFRAQNPCLFRTDGGTQRKENAYVFDFDPARTLDIYEQFANNLSPDTAGDRGDTDSRKNNVRELLNFFPVIGEDDAGSMTELDAERVLSIPRRIHAREVVRTGFRSNFLFQNIGGIFAAPKAVTDILNKLEKERAKDGGVDIPDDTVDRLSLDENGDVDIPDPLIIGTAADKFGSPLYGEIVDSFDAFVREEMGKTVPTEEDRRIERVKKALKDRVIEPVIEKAKEEYGSSLTPSQRRALERSIRTQTDRELNRAVGGYNIDKKQLRKQRNEDLLAAGSREQQKRIEEDFAKREKALDDRLAGEMVDAVRRSAEAAAKETVRTVETAVRNAEKKTMEDEIRDHLRGFARTIPTFLMAYGNEDTTLANFDGIIPEDVFLEVTSITVEEFRKLRDGFDYTDEETGEQKHYKGHLFDEVVFNDSVREFRRKREELADYFSEERTEDIFDYIPPQRTNQIFTPKKVVKMMCDMLEKENPGCFDDPDNTFADLYMKSGLFIAEIIKRLYRSPKMREWEPDDGKRIVHITEKQVFGAAPSEVIYMTAMHFLFGYTAQSRSDFADFSCGELQELYPNFRLADTAALAKEGRLAEWVGEEAGNG